MVKIRKTVKNVFALCYKDVPKRFGNFPILTKLGGGGLTSSGTPVHELYQPAMLPTKKHDIGVGNSNLQFLLTVAISIIGHHGFQNT